MSKAALVSIFLLFAGCVINFKSEHPTKGIIHVDIHYVYPGKNEMNTFEGFYKKEISPGHFAQTNIKLDPGQQLLVLNKAFVLHFYQMPDTFYHAGGEEIKAVIQSLRIKADTLDKTIYWHGARTARTNRAPPSNGSGGTSLTPEKYHARELIEYIDSIVRSTDDYQGLPKSTVVGD
jgi:hypothetical protein